MKERIACPFGPGEAVLKKEERVLTYRKEEFKVVAHYYKCEDCGEEFTTNEADHITLIQAHNQYREKNGIPFPEEIKALREQYHLSASKMSEVFRLGENGFGNYEKGEIPSPAIGTFIKTAENPEIFHSLLHEHFKRNSDRSIAKAMVIAESLVLNKRNLAQWNMIQPDVPSSSNFTGYMHANPLRVENLLAHYINECSVKYNDKLKLSKLLFFTDLCHYREFGHSVSGLSYISNPLGPIPACTDSLFSYFERQDKINQTWEIIDDGMARELFSTKLDGKIERFNEHEKNTIHRVINLYKDSPTADLVKDSSLPDFKGLKGERDELLKFQEIAFC